MELALCVLSLFGQVPLAPVGVSELVLENACDYRVTTFVRRTSAPLGTPWITNALDEGQAVSIKLADADRYNVRITVHTKMTPWEEIGLDGLNVHVLATSDRLLVGDLPLHRQALWVNGARIELFPEQVAVLNVFAGFGKVVLRFPDSGLVGIKPPKPIIRP